MPYFPSPLTGTVTHGDHAEDVILKVMFDVLGIERPSYIDIGAFDPFHMSNTVLLYDTGSRGINVDANPKLMGAFRKHRPEDVNLNCAVGPQRLPSRRLYVHENPGLSSLVPELVDFPVETLDVPTWTIPECPDRPCRRQMA